MKIFRGTTLSVILMLFCNLAIDAKTLTATCRNPKGRIIGSSAGVTIDGSDGMTNSQVIISWNTSLSKANIVINGTLDAPMIEEGYVINSGPSFVSIAAIYDEATWIYSLFSIPQKLLITQHSTGVAMDTSGAAGKIFMADCTMSFQ